MGQLKYKQKTRWGLWEHWCIIASLACFVSLTYAKNSKSFSKKYKKNKPYVIQAIKYSSLFHKMKFKSGDKIRSINGTALKPKDNLHQVLTYLLKKKKKVFIHIIRANKNILISYQKVIFKNSHKLLIKPVPFASIKKLAQRRLSNVTQSTKKRPLKKQIKLIPKKYKKKLQRAYVISDHSFIYKHNDFDSPKLYFLKIGKNILITKKVFRPAHNFGSFYKIFLFHPVQQKKILGYVSEAELVPEFLNNKGSLVSNSIYKIVQNKKRQGLILDKDDLQKQQSKLKYNYRHGLSHNSKIKTSQNTYFIGASASLIFSKLNPLDIKPLIGLKLSGYKLLIPSLITNLNFQMSPNTLKLFFHLDATIAQPIVTSKSYLIYVLGGALLNWKFPDLDPDLDQNYHEFGLGLLAGLSLTIPLNKNILFKLDAKGELDFIQTNDTKNSKSKIKPRPSSVISTSLQFAF